jgi:acyl transferase domain-containing protein
MSDCENALVAGVNAMLIPGTLDMYAAAGLTSPIGKSFVFDARANGFARGEGCGAGVARSWSTDAAESCGPHVGGTAVRQDGKSASLTAPNGRAQKLLLDAVLADAGIGPSTLQLLEAAANGSPMGDAIEAGAIVAAISRGETELLAGSTKANVGHTESASGALGLARLLGAMHRNQVAPNAQLLKVAGPVANALAVPSAATHLSTSLCSSPDLRYGTASSFGLGGTIASALLIRNATLTMTPATRLRLRRRSFSWIEPVCVHVAWRGAINGMELREQFAYPAALATGDVEMQVRSVGLNFRDVLLVLDEYPGPREPPGSDW